MEKLTPRQNAIYEWFRDYFIAHLNNPTIREVAEEFDMTVKSAYDHLMAIATKKYLRHVKTKGFIIDGHTIQLKRGKNEKTIYRNV